MNAVVRGSDMSWAEKVSFVGTRMLDEPQIPTPLKHIFEPSWYIREMFIPAGTLFIGRPHRFGHQIRMVSGRFRWITETSDEVIEAPWDVFTRPGTIAVLETLADTVGRTYHPNPYECRDTGLMEALIFHTADEMRQISDTVRNKLQRLT